MFDNTSAASLELLRFRPELAGTPGFERALRASVERFARFEHPAFSRARTVERLEGDEGLTLVSTHTAGKRLSEMFQWPQRSAGMHPAFVVWLIRWLTTALADLHAHAAVAHGALTADRIVLTPEGQLVIVEHVLGPALDQLGLTADRLWQDFGIIVPPASSNIPRLDGRTDVVQLGLVALSLLVGRRVTLEEYSRNLESVLHEFTSGNKGRASSLIPSLLLWLKRALQVRSDGFESARDAREGLRELPGSVGPQAPELKGSSGHTIAPVPEPSMNHTTTASPADSIPSAEPSPSRLASSDEPVFDGLFGHRGMNAIGRLDFTVLRNHVTVRHLAVGLGLLALVEAVAIGRLLATPPSDVVTPASVPVRIESPGLGDIVMVDGRQVGVTPLELRLGSSTTQTIRVLSREATPVAVTPIATAPAPAPGASTNAAANAIAVAAARQRSGGLRLESPIELQVLEGERVLGSSADGPIVTTAGIHQLDFVNSAVGYRSRQTVEIKRGEIVSLTVQPPDGRVSINALPWAEVWIDGSPIGETPLANLSLPVGQHEIVFRHPQLGERREMLIVKAGVDTRVSATFSR
jgi:hypothetical protein